LAGLGNAFIADMCIEAGNKHEGILLTGAAKRADNIF